MRRVVTLLVFSFVLSLVVGCSEKAAVNPAKPLPDDAKTAVKPGDSVKLPDPYEKK